MMGLKLAFKRMLLRNRLYQKLALTKNFTIEGEVPFVPNGHYCSPVHSRRELANDLNRVYPANPAKPLDIDLNEAGQLELLKQFKEYLTDLPFQPQPGACRYGYINGMYGLADAASLVAMLRHLRPKRLIEVGSGHSSCVTLDTNERWLNNSVQCTFIEPDPERLLSLLRPGDLDRITLHRKRIQEVDLAVFTQLQAGDILFIDSSHVSKVGSDVNHLYFNVLPILAEGVYIHIHDVFYPFEYPQQWTFEYGRAWNEQYILRALLMNSQAYEIIYFSDYLIKHHKDALLEYASQILNNPGDNLCVPGGNIWLQKTGKR